MTTRQQIANWFQAGVEVGATHMIIAWDTFGYDDYPVYTTSAQETRAKLVELYGASMHTVHEVYSLTKPPGPQLASTRAWNIE